MRQPSPGAAAASRSAAAAAIAGDQRRWRQGGAWGVSSPLPPPQPAGARKGMWWEATRRSASSTRATLPRAPPTKPPHRRHHPTPRCPLGIAGGLPLHLAITPLVPAVARHPCTSAIRLCRWGLVHRGEPALRLAARSSAGGEGGGNLRCGRRSSTNRAFLPPPEGAPPSVSGRLSVARGGGDATPRTNGSASEKNSTSPRDSAVVARRQCRSQTKQSRRATSGASDQPAFF